MKRLKIQGNNLLSGTIRIGGAKNSAVALLPAILLTNNKVTLTNVPDISDVDILCDTLEFLGCNVRKASHSIVVDPSCVENKMIPNELSKKLRASYYFMSSLLAKYKYVKMYFPGGCSIGSRPIDQTLKIFKALGCNVIEDNNLFTISCDELVGCEINLDMPSVGATINGVIVSSLASGVTIINNCAREPEIVDVCNMLNKMGAKISGAGTSVIKITGVKSLDGCFHDVIPDRIETGTYVCMGLMTGNYLRIENIIPEHNKVLLDTLYDMGADIDIGSDYVVCNKSDNMLATNIKTDYFPGFPTDLQQIFVSLLSICHGKSEVYEKIYENRFMNIPYLNKMGANININERYAYVNGPCDFVGCEVEATDLRASASLLLAALYAKGDTIINNVDYLLRGYEEIIDKLTNVGAKIELEEI